MLAQHSQSLPPSLPKDLLPASAKLTKSLLLKGVRSFLKGSAPGSFVLRPSHLLEAVVCPSPDRVNHMLYSLTSFVNLVGGGCTPPSIVLHLCGATLLTLQIKSRGICTIEILCLETFKCLVMALRSTVQSILPPHLLGVCVK